MAVKPSAAAKQPLLHRLRLLAVAKVPVMEAAVCCVDSAMVDCEPGPPNRQPVVAKEPVMGPAAPARDARPDFSKVAVGCLGIIEMAATDVVDSVVEKAKNSALIAELGITVGRSLAKSHTRWKFRRPVAKPQRTSIPTTRRGAHVIS